MWGDCFAEQDTNKVLAISRIMVAWQPVGIACGVFDMCKRYVGGCHSPLPSKCCHLGPQPTIELLIAMHSVSSEIQA